MLLHEPRLRKKEGDREAALRQISGRLTAGVPAVRSVAPWHERRCFRNPMRLGKNTINLRAQLLGVKAKAGQHLGPCSCWATLLAPRMQNRQFRAVAGTSDCRSSGAKSAPLGQARVCPTIEKDLK